MEKELGYEMHSLELFSRIFQPVEASQLTQSLEDVPLNS